MNTSAIWTKDFILNCIVCFVVNQSYYMTMVVISQDYAATALHASLAEAGLACRHLYFRNLIWPACFWADVSNESA